MGKRSKAGTSLRQKKRVAETYKELEEAQIEQSDQQRVQSKADDELFVLDTNRNETAASLRAAARAKNEKDASSKKRKYEPSEKDKRQVKKMLEVHGGKGAIALAEKGKAKLEQKRIVKRMAGMAKAGKPTFDLWDEVPPSSNNASAAVAGKKRTKMVAVPVGKPAPGGTNPVALVPKDTPLPTSSIDSAFEAPAQPAPKLSNRQLKARRHAQATAKKQLAVDLPIPGQSYHPDREQHQEAIGEALSIEIRRNEAEEYKSRPISEGMSAFTKEFIMGESDSEEESSDEEDEDEEAVGTAKLIKKKDKLTRAQRNKQKRVKAEATALKERKLRKQFMHQINEVHIHNKAVKKSEKEHAERQLELAKLRREKRAQPLGKDVWNSVSQKDPIRAPSLPVALTEELQGNAGGNGGLRTVTPKGSLVTDRLESMVSRNMIQKKKADGRRIVQGKRRPKVRGAQGTEYLLV